MSQAYLQQVSGQTTTAVPKPSSAPIGPDGKISTDWWRFFNSLSSKPIAESPVILGISPTTFVAPVAGTLLVIGGTVSTIMFQRKNSYATGVTGGFIPMSPQDQVSIVYSAMPSVIWLPR